MIVTSIINGNNNNNDKDAERSFRTEARGTKNVNANNAKNAKE